MRDADRNLGRTHRLPKQSATAWVSVIGDGGSCGLGMAATIGTLFGAFDVAHYRPKERPDSVRIVHPKTGEEAWWPLFGNTGRPIYPDLTAELDAMKADTVGGPKMLRRDGPHRRNPVPQPWITHSSKFIIHRRANTTSIMTWIGPFSARSSIHIESSSPAMQVLAKGQKQWTQSTQ